MTFDIRIYKKNTFSGGTSFHYENVKKFLHNPKRRTIKTDFVSKVLFFLSDCESHLRSYFLRRPVVIFTLTFCRSKAPLNAFLFVNYKARRSSNQNWRWVFVSWENKTIRRRPLRRARQTGTFSMEIIDYGRNKGFHLLVGRASGEFRAKYFEPSDDIMKIYIFI